MTSPGTIPATGTALSGPGLVAGIDLLTTRERDADHEALALTAALARNGATDITVATHWARVGVLRHVALSVGFLGIDFDGAHSHLVAVAERSGAAWGLLLGGRYSGQPELRGVLEATVAAHLTRGSGRLVGFPGSPSLVGTLPVADVIARSAIDRVQLLSGGSAPGAALLNTRDFVRPRWSCGLLSLDVQAGAGGTLVPFEVPDPTPCCASHS